jgi:uncharacterized integral membrane protein
MIDFGFVVYGLLLAAMLGLAVFTDSRRRARRRQSDAAAYAKNFSL